MRKLGLKDAWALARIINKANIKDDIIAFANEIYIRQQSGKKLNVEDVGLEFVITLITSMSSESVENQFYKLYADVKGTTVEDVAVTDFSTLKSDIKTIISENDLKSFFQSLSGLMSKSSD